MWSNVRGDGFPFCNAMVTLLFPMAIPSSNSNCFLRPSARANHFALFFGSRTARPKCPTTPRVKGTFIRKGRTEVAAQNPRFFLTRRQFFPSENQAVHAAAPLKRFHNLRH